MEQYSSARVSAPAPVQVCGRGYDDLAHSCNALRRASARPLPRHERLQNRGINAFQRCMYTLVCIRNKPSALSHSDVHLLTHDVQLPAMMCNYTFYTYKINALKFNMIITYLYSPNGRAERARRQFILPTGARPPPAQTSTVGCPQKIYFHWQRSSPRIISCAAQEP